MSKVYDWWLDQVCLGCNYRNENCECGCVPAESILSEEE